jgi:nicotinate dehydrogenase subunit B
MTLAALSRRGVLAGAGALVLTFRIPTGVLAQEGEVQGAAASAAKLPGSLGQQPYLDAWIRIDANAAVSVFTGKAELGQGLKTAIVQIAAEELVVDPKSITLVTADTARTANEGYTAGSQSMQNSGTAVRHAAAQVRELMIGEAARRLNVAAAELRAEAGRVQTHDGRALS